MVSSRCMPTSLMGTPALSLSSATRRVGNAGLDKADEAQSIDYCERLFKENLGAFAYGESV